MAVPLCTNADIPTLGPDPARRAAASATHRGTFDALYSPGHHDGRSGSSSTKAGRCKALLQLQLSRPT